MILEAVVEAADQRASLALAEVEEALKTLKQDQSSSSRCTTVLAIGKAQTALRYLDKLNDSHDKVSENVHPRAYVAIENRKALRKAIVRGQASLDAAMSRPTYDSEAADHANALRSLMDSRSLLLREVNIVSEVVNGLAGSTETLHLVHSSLVDVDVTIHTAANAVRRALAIHSREDLVLKCSLAVFGLCVIYVLLNRVLRLFPVVEFVAV